MDERTTRSRDEQERTRTSTSSPENGEDSRDERRGSSVDASVERPSSADKPALTERERGERWPIG